MNDIYRGHEIVMQDGNPKSAVIIERQTGTPLPTKVTALPDESEGACLVRRRRATSSISISRRLAEGPELRNISAR